MTTTTTTTTASAAEGTCIVGGGLAGLATAAALHNIAGVQSLTVLEQASEKQFQDDTAGAAVQLGPNGLRALRAIGGEDLIARIFQEGTCLKGNAIILPGAAASGKTTTMTEQNPKVVMLPDSTESDTGLPQVLIRWGVLRSILMELLPQDAIRTGVGHDIVGYSIRPNEDEDCAAAASVQLVGANGNILTMNNNNNNNNNNSNRHIPLVVAADGIRSTFQWLVHTGDTTLPRGKERESRQANLRDGGRVNVKAVVPVALDRDTFQPRTTYSYFSPCKTAACFAGPAGEDSTYWAISIADNDEEHNDEHDDVDDEEMDDPTRTGRFLDKNTDTSPDSVKSQLLAKLQSLKAPECQFVIDLIEHTDADCIFVARSEERQHVGPSLVSADGGVVLVGDAAHAMSPAYGQSANFAFEDAATLATCLKQQDDDDDLRTALQAYSRARVERCVEMQRRSVERTQKAMRGEVTEDVSKWIFQWTI